MEKASLPGLYGITDPVIMPGKQLYEKCKSALQCGLRVLQYRNKLADYAVRKREACQLLAICRDHNAKLIINDDTLLAGEISADGVHLGQEDMSIAKARTLLGSQAIIGCTCHNSLDLAVKAEAAGASYTAFGRFFHSRTKSEASGAELSILSQARENTRKPRLAIGGITVENAVLLYRAGADTLAVCHSLFHLENPGSAVMQFRQCLADAQDAGMLAHSV